MPFDDKSLQMDVYVDSDFMGIYGKELRTNPNKVKSQTGHVISLNGCPIIWGSKLQDSAPALSTMMAEYYALSSTMREVLPLCETIRVLAENLGLQQACNTDFKTTVWEDNNGCLHLANMDPGQHTPCSKFYDCKVHWFRAHLKSSQENENGKIKVLKIDTKEQLSDLFTKPLDAATFTYLREKLMGW